MAAASALYSRATTSAAAPGYGVATPPPPRGGSFDYRRVSFTPVPAAPAAVRSTPELPCGSFLQAMQEAAAAAPLVTQPLHRQQAPPRQEPASPCVFSMLGWNEMLPDELLAP